MWLFKVHLFNMLKTKQTDVADCQTEETETCPASAFVLGVSLAAAIGRLAASGLDLIGWPRHKGPAALHMLSVIETIARRLARGRIQNTISSVFVSFVKNWLSDVLRTGPETRLWFLFVFLLTSSAAKQTTDRNAADSDAESERVVRRGHERTTRECIFMRRRASLRCWWER